MFPDKKHRVNKKGHKMADIPNTEYITVNANGIFVGGKPATHYRGVSIYDTTYVKDVFAWIQKQNPNITELHVLSSETSGYFATVGNPSSTHGRYVWCRVKNNDGKLGGWVFYYAYRFAPYCAHKCARNCAGAFHGDPAFRRAVLGVGSFGYRITLIGIQIKSFANLWGQSGNVDKANNLFIKHFSDE